MAKMKKPKDSKFVSSFNDDGVVPINIPDPINIWEKPKQKATTPLKGKKAELKRQQN